jgi:hypothetical protein
VTQWEFTYFELRLPSAAVGDPEGELRRAQKRIEQLGSQGWEPVGEIAFTRGVGSHESGAEHLLMFKRPAVSDTE